MKFSKYCTFSLTCLCFISAQLSANETTKPAAATPKAWAQDFSDIQPDTNVIYGTLPNGFRYLLMPNEQPPGRVSMRLHIDAGSLSEREDQRGVAHFLEHMVFNGSKNFPDASLLIPKMQRLGIAFGAHANAYTSFDETVYMLDLPNNEADTLKLGFDVMRDFGDGAFLREEEIEKERGVILSEKTSRDSVNSRLMEKQFQALLPDALLADRFPIGTEEVIKTAPRSAFTDFYSEYYIPSRMTFVYTGDFDAVEAEKRIIATFASMQDPENRGDDPVLGQIPSGQGFQTLVMTDKEVDTTDITLISLKAHEIIADTKANRGEKLPLAIANTIISQRLSTLSKEENSPITSGYTFHYPLFKFVDMGGITVNAKDHDWKSALPILEQELRKAQLFGFTESEFKEAKSNLINAYEQAVKAAPSRKTDELASSLAKHIHKGAVFSTPEDDLAILLENLAEITGETCHNAFQTFWETQDRTLILTSNHKQGDEEEALATLYKHSQTTELKAPEEKELAPFAYTDFGPAGEITKQGKVADLDITQIDFHNGCACNIKKTDFDKNAISIIARVGGGKLTMPTDKQGLDMFTSSVFTSGGLGKHSTDDLKRILAGRNVGIGFNVDEDAFTFSGATTPDDLELQLQLLCAYLIDPGFRPEAERLFKAQLPSIFSQMKYTAAGAQSKMSAFLRGDDPRFIFPTEEQAYSLSTQDAQSWLTPALKNDYLELSIVGDIDEATTIELLAKTIGALPKRALTKPDYQKLRHLENLPTPGISKRYTFESKIPTGSAMVAWKAPSLEKDSIGQTRRMNILSNIFRNRLREKIREELGEAYSPYAAAQPSDTFSNLGFIIAVSPGKPEQAEPIGKLILDIAEELAKQGATQDELDRALAPTLSSLQQTLRQNDYWLHTVISRSQEQPYRLDWARNRDTDYASIQLDEVNTLAQTYLRKDNAFRFEIIPEAPVE
ncbi:MAG: M16 family metallopeptidase [Akkermansiaceae bacterium]